MLSPADIRAQCERRYAAYLRSLVSGESFFPLQIRFGRPSSTAEWGALQTEIGALAGSDLGYRIDWEEVNTRRWGRQRLPRQVWIDSEVDFLRMLRKQTEVQLFKEQVRATRETCPELEAWMAPNALWMIEHAAVWSELLLVCRYFMGIPRPALYARELPIAVHTKFVEQHHGVLSNLLDFLLPTSAKVDSSHFEQRFGLRYDEPRVHFRLLDPKLKQTLQLSVDDLSVPLSQFVALGCCGLTVLIAENKKTFLTLPPLPETMGVWGGGGAAQLLAEVAWCAGCRLIYWGDIDVHGFHILSRLRRAFPSVVSVMMGEATWERFARLRGSAKPAMYEETELLTPGERTVYELARAGNLLLEQEKLPHEYGVAELRGACERERVKGDIEGIAHG